MVVYKACTFGRIPEYDEEDQVEGRRVTTFAHGTIVLGRFFSLPRAKQILEDAFLAEPEDNNSPWIREARVWAPSRDPAAKGKIYLWSMLPAAAPAVDDPNRAFYPQARTTLYWIEEMEVL